MSNVCLLIVPDNLIIYDDVCLHARCPPQASLTPVCDARGFRRPEARTSIIGTARAAASERKTSREWIPSPLRWLTDEKRSDDDATRRDVHHIVRRPIEALTRNILQRTARARRPLLLSGAAPSLQHDAGAMPPRMMTPYV